MYNNKVIYLKELQNHLKETIDALEELKFAPVLKNFYKVNTNLNFFIKYKAEILKFRDNIKWFAIAYKGIGEMNPLYSGIFDFRYISNLEETRDRFNNILEDGLRVILESDTRTSNKMKKIEYNVNAVLGGHQDIDSLIAGFSIVQNYLILLEICTTKENVLKVFGLENYDKKYIDIRENEEYIHVNYLVHNSETEKYVIHECRLNKGTFEIGTSKDRVESFETLKKRIKNKDLNKLDKVLATDLYPEMFV